MFRKLVSNLPFHPSLLPQVSIYLQSLKKEQLLRKLGVLFIVLTLFIQIFLYISPSKSSLASSTADIIHGATSKSEILNAYNNGSDNLGRTDIKSIYDFYGIGASQIDRSSETTISNGENGNYIINSRSPSHSQDTFINIPGSIDSGVYEFPIESWKQGQFAENIPALTGISSLGFRYWILLKGGGNIVYQKDSKQPSLEITKKITSGSSAKSDEYVNYLISFRNRGSAISNNTEIVDVLPKGLTYESFSSNLDVKIFNTGQKLSWKINNQNSTLAPSSRWYFIELKLKPNYVDQISNKYCNGALISASNSSEATTGSTDADKCVTISQATCPGTGAAIKDGDINNCVVNCPDGSIKKLEQSCEIPQMVCSNLVTKSTPTWSSRKYETSFLSQPGAQLKIINYYINNKIVTTKSLTDSPQLFEYTFPAEGEYTVKSELIASNGSVQQSQNCQLTDSISKPKELVARITTDKNVENISQGIKNANNTTARPGDELKYTLSVSNFGDAPGLVKLTGEYSENIADILEYSDLKNLGDANYNKTTQTLSWKEIEINPGETINKVFTVSVKNPIPSTPVSASNPLSYDNIMQNKFGREVVINIDKPLIKIVEQNTTYLPKYSSSTSLLLSIFVTTLVGFFLSRNTLLIKELRLIREEHTEGTL